MHGPRVALPWVSEVLPGHFKWKEILPQDSKMTGSSREMFPEFQDDFGFFQILICVSSPHPTPSPSNPRRTTIPLPSASSLNWTTFGLRWEMRIFIQLASTTTRHEFTLKTRQPALNGEGLLCPSGRGHGFLFCSKYFNSLAGVRRWERCCPDPFSPLKG